MTYKMNNGKTINIPDKEIEKLMSSLDLSRQDAIDLWLCDNNLEEDEEQAELDEKAKKVKIDRDIVVQKPKKERKTPERKVSDEKKELFSEILSNLEDVYKENVQILNENKLISIKIGEKTFKIDIIEQRTKKS